MDLWIVVLLGFFISFLSVVQRVDEAKTKETQRKVNPDFHTRSSKWFLSFFFVVLTIPLFLIYQFHTWWLFLIILLLGLFRGIPFIWQQKIRAEFKDTSFQKNTTLTLYENFIGPIASLVTFGIFYSFTTEISIFWYLLTPSIGLFLLWAMRTEGFKLTKEIKLLFFSGLLTTTIESILIIFCLYFPLDFLRHTMELPFNINESIVLFIILMTFSQFLSLVYFSKDLIKDYKEKNLKYTVKNGFIHCIHDIFLFAAWSLVGPILLFVRRGAMIPLQNLYLNVIEGKKVSKLFKTIYKKPLLELRGGKDFIISFVDIVFNRMVKYIISLIS